MSKKVLVVGSGIIGIACAHYLSEAGYHVTVIDQGRIGNGSSYGNCGMITPSHILPLAQPSALMDGAKSFFNANAAFRLKLQWRLELYRWLWRFTRLCSQKHMINGGRKLQPILESSLQEYRHLFASNPSLEAEWKETGLLYLYKSERGFSNFGATAELMANEFGLNSRRIDGKELPLFDSAIKSDLAGAFYFEEEGRVRPDRLVKCWAQMLTDKGVEFIEECCVDSIEKDASSITGLITSKDKLTSDQYVFATGAWSPKLSSELECDIPIETGKGYSVTMKKPQHCPRIPIALGEAHTLVTPFDSGYRIGSIMEFSGFDTSLPAHRIRQLRESTRDYLVESTAEPIEEQWYGWRPMTWDSLPIIGRLPKLNNALLATGHSMLGVTLAPVTGRLIAEMITESEPHVAVDAFSVSRFK
jgi:D-amino-acid dehydrogenase